MLNDRLSACLVGFGEKWTITNLRQDAFEALDFFTAYSHETDFYKNGRNPISAQKAIDGYTKLLSSGYFDFLNRKIEDLKKDSGL